MDLAITLARAASSDFATYDPGAVIAAVDALWPRGKDGALAAIDDFLAGRDLDADPHQGLFLVLRVLFDVDGDVHPPMRLGGSMPPPPDDPTTIPRFPIMMIDDVPLMLVAGYMLGGEAEPLASHLDHYRAHGRLRAAPLAPSAAPAGLLPGFERDYQRAYGAAPSAGERELIAGQVARLASSAH